MNKSESITNLAAALVKAQAAFPAIHRSKEVTVSGMKGSYKFCYAPFEEILRGTKPALSANEMAFVQTVAGDKLVTTLLHSSGEWLASEVGIINTAGTAQSYGSALTYARRYGFCVALGIQSDDDDDANAADGNTITEQKEKGSARPGTPSETKKHAYEDLRPDMQEFVRGVAADIEALLAEERNDEAYRLMLAKTPDIEERLALSFLLGSKASAALKKAGEQADFEKRSAERARHQASRPEGMKVIKDEQRTTQ